MIREDIIRIAEDNGIVIIGEAMFRFAALVAAAERDQRAFELAVCYRCGWDSGANAERVECARACIEVGATKANSDDGLDIADLCAAAIQARGTK